MSRSSALFAGFLIVSLVPSIARPQASPPPDEPAAINAEPRWFKGNLHTHSLWSDGNDYPEMIVDFYARRGYQFLALSDHNILAQGQRWMSVAQANKRAGQDGFDRYLKRFGDDWVETRAVNGDRQVRLKPLGEYRTLFERPDRFLLIQGEEITDRFESKPIHMNASNVQELIKPQGGKSVPEVMANNLAAVEEQARRLGRPILGHLNHPNFGYAITAEELAMVTKERFFEVYNGHPDVHHQGDETHAGIERMWDIINTIRVGEMKEPPVAGLATDDSHNYFGQGGSSPGKGWVMVRARFLTPESIILAMQSGDFYASSGVTLQDVRYAPESKTLEVQVKPEGDARYTIQFVGTLKGYDPTRKPVVDREGKTLPVTQRYSDDVGKVLETVEGTSATYRLTGEELYVRAVVTSDQAPANPTFPEQKAQAWTQPVGWEK
ncbi:PHP domain-containing protein [Tundrisphaera lichenicola]|uniref:PHP domain-containing protein n=1 Tax=Tundrisphaera lichenicola TaxID=2029860 RepID=UPI003EBE459F